MKRTKFFFILIFIYCSTFIFADIRDTEEFTIEAIIPGNIDGFSELVVRNLYTGSSVMDPDSVYGGQVVIDGQNINLGRGSHLLNGYIPMFVVDYTTNRFKSVDVSINVSPFAYRIENSEYYYVLPSYVKAETAVNYSNSSISENVLASITSDNEQLLNGVKFSSIEGENVKYNFNLSAKNEYSLSAGELISFDITYSVKIDGVTYDNAISSPDPSVSDDNGFVSGNYVMNVNITLNGV